MYVEFIIIYVLLVVILALLITLLIATIKNKKENSNTTDTYNAFVSKSTPPQINTPTPAPTNAGQEKSKGVVFCTKCACQYPATDKFCPNCGNPRS